MECIPAIDVRRGRSVRLLRGDFAAETVYGDPLEQAVAYAKGGATRLHVVDLDAARSGLGENDGVVAAIAAAVPVPLEVGGGIRDAERAATLLSLGVDRVVLGTAAIEHPELVAALAEAFPGRVAVGLDHRSSVLDGVVVREVAVRGWEVGSGQELDAVLGSLAGLDLAALIVTDIGRDGTLEGPDLVGLRHVLEVSAHPVIASGGIGSASDLRALAGIEGSGRGLEGAIVGRALLAGAMTLEEARRACAA